MNLPPIVRSLVPSLGASASSQKTNAPTEANAGSLREGFSATQLTTQRTGSNPQRAPRASFQLQLPPEVHLQVLEQLLQAEPCDDVAGLLQAATRYAGVLRSCFVQDRAQDVLSQVQSKHLQRLTIRVQEADKFVQEQYTKSGQQEFQDACRLVPWISDSQRHLLVESALMDGDSYFAAKGLRELCKHYGLLPVASQKMLRDRLGLESPFPNLHCLQRYEAVIGLLSAPLRRNVPGPVSAGTRGEWVRALLRPHASASNLLSPYVSLERLQELVDILDRLDEESQFRVSQEVLAFPDNSRRDLLRAKGFALAGLASRWVNLRPEIRNSILDWVEEHSSSFDFCEYSSCVRRVHKAGGGKTDQVFDRRLTDAALGCEGLHDSENRLSAVVHACLQHDAFATKDRKDQLISAWRRTTPAEKAYWREIWAAAGVGLWSHLDPKERETIRASVMLRDAGPESTLSMLIPMAVFVPALDSESRKWLVSLACDTLERGVGGGAAFLRELFPHMALLCPSDVERVNRLIESLSTRWFAMHDELPLMHNSCRPPARLH